MQRPRTVAGQEQEDGRADDGDEVEGEEEDEFEDLPDREGRVDGGRGGRFAESFERVRLAVDLGVWVQGTCGSEKGVEALVHEDGVEDIDERFVDEKGFEEQGDDGGAFAQDEKGCVYPG